MKVKTIKKIWKLKNRKTKWSGKNSNIQLNFKILQKLKICLKIFKTEGEITQIKFSKSYKISEDTIIPCFCFTNIL